MVTWHLVFKFKCKYTHQANNTDGDGFGYTDCYTMEGKLSLDVVLV